MASCPRRRKASRTVPENSQAMTTLATQDSALYLGVRVATLA
jgi:hypothetical protein